MLLDVMTDDPSWCAWSAEALERCGDASELAINPIIYAEVSIRFGRIEDLDAALPEAEFRRLPLPFEAGFSRRPAGVEWARELSRLRPREPRAPPS